MYYNQNVDFVELLWEDFMFQIDNRDSKKQEKMYYPRFTKAVIHHFISKDNSISMRNRLFMHSVQDDSILGSLRFVSKTEEYHVYGALDPTRMTNRKMMNSTAYKTYLAFSTRAATPKKARKFKKPASSSKKNTLVVVEEPIDKPAKKPVARRQSAGVQIRDTPSVSVSKKKTPTKTERSKGIELLSEAALLEEAQLKKAIKRSKQEINIHQAGGSSEGANSKSEVPDEQRGKSTDTGEGTGLIPGVPDVSKADSFEKDEFVHTDDENVDDEEYERINKEMYDDVNEGKGDEEMTNAKKVNADNKNVNQEVTGDQVNELCQITIHATIKFEVQIIVKEYLGTSMDDALYKSIVEDENAMDKGVADRPDQGLKKKKTGKDTEPSKKAKSIRTSKGTPKSQPKSTGKSTQAEDTVFEAEDTQVP
ncbi:hypothetical protein Tco_0941737 [Tanacetum coccineum]|uniref:Uncharacterized protein n=1 Tax=Tanacetum coccineum TaxID=301880 RepID=A0ABQ5DSI1_9ASTR